MTTNRFFRELRFVLMALLVAVSVTSVSAQKNSRGKTTTTKVAQSQSSKQSSKTSAIKRPKTSTQTKAKPMTAAEVKRQQEANDREIALTREKIRTNDAQVKKGLSELTRLQGDIEKGRELVNKATGEVEVLDKEIGGLQSNIDAEQQSLEKMRADYLKVIKKMRPKKQRQTAFSFLLSSKDFNQGMRRLRYLRRMSAWRSDRSKKIETHVGELKNQTTRLSAVKVEKGAALNRQVTAQNQLQGQYQRQDQLVGELKRNGTALKSHLAKKQAEANALKGRIAAIIAEENRRAEAERQRQAKEAERQAKAEAERQRQAQLAQAEKAKRAEQQAQSKDSDKKDKKENTLAVNTAKSESSTANNRSESNVSATANTATAAPTPVRGGAFDGLRGSLPRPVAGAFRVTSRFGRHSLPDLPDVVYDNPGIDAEVSAGASALVVYAGKVSGVYVIPGYQTVVIVSHGGYYTVYGNILSPSVKVGDNVKQGSSLGRLAGAEGDASHSTIHFEVWRNREKLNPLDWIR